MRSTSAYARIWVSAARSQSKRLPIIIRWQKWSSGLSMYYLFRRDPGSTIETNFAYAIDNCLQLLQLEFSTNFSMVHYNLNALWIISFNIYFSIPIIFRWLILCRDAAVLLLPVAYPCSFYSVGGFYKSLLRTCEKYCLIFEHNILSHVGGWPLGSDPQNLVDTPVSYWFMSARY